MVHRVQRIGVAQMAKMLGVLDLVLGAIIGVCFFAFSSMMPMGAMASGFRMGGVAALIGFPLFYGVFGYLSGALIAWLYNLVAGWTGGLEFDLEQVGPE